MEQKCDDEKKIQVIKKALALLEKNQEWRERYKGYTSKLCKKEIGHFPFNKPNGLSLYSSVSKDTYDLRFDGQNVGEIKSSNNGVYLHILSDYIRSYFKTEMPSSKKWIDWKCAEAISFRKFFRDKAQEATKIKLRFPEHRVENYLLKEFSKSLEAEGKKLCYIQPIKLHRCSFQFPTPLKASDHNPTYSAHKGGGIDILARVRTHNWEPRICVMEVKDGNKQGESQSVAMEQALIYAVFLSKLLRSESGQQWWDFLRNNNKDSKVIPSHLDIDVVTIMPQGNTKEFSDKFIDVPELYTTFHCHSLYYNDEDFKNGKFTFSGTYPNQLKKYKRKA